MTMGDLGYLISCLTYDVRDCISKRIGFNLASDTDSSCIACYSPRLASTHTCLEKFHLSIAYSGEKRYNININWGMCLRMHT